MTHACIFSFLKIFFMIKLVLAENYDRAIKKKNVSKLTFNSRRLRNLKMEDFKGNRFAKTDLKLFIDLSINQVRMYVVTMAF